MAKLASINISQAIACDDIRQENNGKFILIGVYAGSIGLPFFPTHIPLGFWMTAKPSRVGDYQVDFRIKTPSMGPIGIQGQMLVHIQEENAIIALVLPPTLLTIDKPGDIILEYKENGGSWRNICSLEAKLATHSSDMSLSA